MEEQVAGRRVGTAASPPLPTLQLNAADRDQTSLDKGAGRLLKLPWETSKEEDEPAGSTLFHEL
jgi:hypothetical protein